MATSRQAIRRAGRGRGVARLAIAPSAGMIRIRFVGIISDPEHSGTPQHHFMADTMVRQREVVKRAGEGNYAAPHAAVPVS